MKKLLAAMFVALLMVGCGEEAVVDKWDEWEANPEPYGGLEVLTKIRKAKESNATRLDLDADQITDLSPLAGLTNLRRLDFHGYQISDEEWAMLRKALPNCKISLS